MIRKAGVSLILMAAMVVVSQAGKAFAYDRPPQKPAIVLAAFGTTDVEALASILNIRDRVKKAFPDYDVHLAFTSNIIRGIWHERSADDEFRQENPGIPEAVYDIGNPLSVLGNIQERGARLILVQSLHVTDGEEYTDLVNIVGVLENIKMSKAARHPFPWIGVGEPALGVGDGQAAYLERAAKAFAPLVRKAWDSGAALVLMAHGNEHLDQKVFVKFEQVLRKTYGQHIYIGSVENPPFAEEIVEAIKERQDAPKGVLLAPMMVVAGDHAQNDMAGDEEDSWASVFKAADFAVETHLVGLGSNESWADIYVEHLKALEPSVQKKKADDESAGDQH